MVSGRKRLDAEGNEKGWDGREESRNTTDIPAVLVIPITACFEAVYGIIPEAATCEFAEPRFTIEPRPKLLFPWRRLS